MFNSYFSELVDEEAAAEARRVELEAISASEGLAGYDGDWAEEDQLTPSQRVAKEADDLYGGAFENAEFTPNPEFAG